MVATSTTQLGVRPLFAALDVAELFEADVGAEARFGQHIAIFANQLERDLVRDDGRVAVRDVGKRAGMHKGRRAFQRLHQVGHDGVLHQDGQRAAHTEVVGGDGLAVAVGADHHASQPLAHIGQAGGERQDRHDFAGHGDVEAG